MPCVISLNWLKKVFPASAKPSPICDTPSLRVAHPAESSPVMICQTPLKIVPKPTTRFLTALKPVLNEVTKVEIKSLTALLPPVKVLNKYLPKAITMSVTELIMLPKNAEICAITFWPSADLLSHVCTALRARTIAPSTIPRGVDTKAHAAFVILPKFLIVWVKGIPIPSIVSENEENAPLAFFTCLVVESEILCPTDWSLSFNLPHAVLCNSAFCDTSALTSPNCPSVFCASWDCCWSCANFSFACVSCTPRVCIWAATSDAEDMSPAFTASCIIVSRFFICPSRVETIVFCSVNAVRAVAAADV